GIKPKVECRARDVINQPCLGKVLHPRADARRAGAKPHQPEIAVLEPFKYPREPSRFRSRLRHNSHPLPPPVCKQTPAIAPVSNSKFGALNHCDSTHNFSSSFPSPFATVLIIDHSIVPEPRAAGHR